MRLNHILIESPYPVNNGKMFLKRLISISIRYRKPHISNLVAQRSRDNKTTGSDKRSTLSCSRNTATGDGLVWFIRVYLGLIVARRQHNIPFVLVKDWGGFSSYFLLLLELFHLERLFLLRTLFCRTRP